MIDDMWCDATGCGLILLSIILILIPSFGTFAFTISFIEAIKKNNDTVVIVFLGFASVISILLTIVSFSVLYCLFCKRNR